MLLLHLFEYLDIKDLVLSSHNVDKMWLFSDLFLIAFHRTIR